MFRSAKMCGLAGYAGSERASEVLLRLILATERVEERKGGGAGMAVLSGKLEVRKDAGFVKDVSKRVKFDEIEGSIGIAHNRSYPRTTEASQVNAHPHLDCKGEIAVVHSGEIDNFKELRNELEKKGHKLISHIDTAVIPHVIEKYYRGNLKEAVKKAVKEFYGEYAFLALSKKEPEKLVGVMHGRKLFIGKGSGFCVFCSYDGAIHSTEVRELNQEMAVMARQGYQAEKI